MDYCEAFPLLFMVSTAREVSEPEAVPIRHKFRESESACGSQSSIYNHKFLFKKIGENRTNYFTNTVLLVLTVENDSAKGVPLVVRVLELTERGRTHSDSDPKQVD